MRILIVSPGRLPVPATRGGAVETLTDLLLEYNEIHEQHDIWITSVWDREAELKAHTYQYVRFLYIKQGRLSTFVSERHLIPYRMVDYIYSKKVLKVLSEEKRKFDCIVIENELVNGWVMMQKMKGRYIYHAHNDTLEVKKKKDIRFLKSCHKVITVSKFLGTELKSKAGLPNTEVVYNGVDTEMFKRTGHEEQAAKKREQYGLSMNDFVIAFAGRLVEEKGIRVLVDALRFIPKEDRAVILVIGSSFFGKTRDTAYIRSLRRVCASGGLRIIFTGYVEHSEMPVYYSMADAGCIPSLWNEPFGLTAAEQMSMELPVIATDSGAIPEIVDSSCGYVFPRDKNLSRNIASAVMELRRDADVCRVKGKKARKIVTERFSRETFCKNWFKSVQIGERE